MQNRRRSSTGAHSDSGSMQPPRLQSMSRHERGSSQSKDEILKVKFLCSVNGAIKFSDGKLRYIGGETRIFTVSRDIEYSLLMSKLTDFYGESLALKYTLPDMDLDTLVSVDSNTDLASMMEEYDKIEKKAAEGKQQPPLRLFLFPTSSAEGEKNHNGHVGANFEKHLGMEDAMPQPALRSMYHSDDVEQRPGTRSQNAHFGIEDALPQAVLEQKHRIDNRDEEQPLEGRISREPISVPQGTDLLAVNKGRAQPRLPPSAHSSPLRSSNKPPRHLDLLQYSHSLPERILASSLDPPVSYSPEQSSDCSTTSDQEDFSFPIVSSPKQALRTPSPRSPHDSSSRLSRPFEPGTRPPNLRPPIAPPARSQHPFLSHTSPSRVAPTLQRSRTVIGGELESIAQPRLGQSSIGHVHGEDSFEEQTNPVHARRWSDGQRFLVGHEIGRSGDEAERIRGAWYQELPSLEIGGERSGFYDDAGHPVGRGAWYQELPSLEISGERSGFYDDAGHPLGSESYETEETEGPMAPPPSRAEGLGVGRVTDRSASPANLWSAHEAGQPENTDLRFAPSPSSAGAPSAAPGTSRTGRFMEDWEFDVFISHAGTRKGMANDLEGCFHRMGLRAFVDVIALEPGDKADVKMSTSASKAPVGLVLFDGDFVLRKWPMAELKLIVEADTLLPVIIGMSTTKFEEAWRDSPIASQLDPAFFERVRRTTFLVSHGLSLSRSGSGELALYERRKREEICFAVTRMLVEVVCPHLPDRMWSGHRIRKIMQAVRFIGDGGFDGLRAGQLKKAWRWLRLLQNICKD